MGRFRGMFVTGFLVAVAAGSGCSFEYIATVNCETCRGMESVVVSDCSSESAINQAKAGCEILNGKVVGTPTVESRLGFVCSIARLPHELEPVRETFALFHKAYDAVFGADEIAAADDDPLECTQDRISFKVMVHNDYRPFNVCPDAKEMRIAYTRFLSEGQSEPVTLAAQVPFGGSHEFTVSDGFSRPQDGGKVRVAVSAQLYDASNFPECTLLDGFTGASYMLSEGEQLIIHEHPETGGLIHTINSSGLRVRLAATKVMEVELKPIPDPKFTSRKR